MKATQVKKSGGSSRLDEAVRRVRQYDNRAVIAQLERYGIAKGDYEVEMNIYHSEDKRGVPYLTLLVRKDLPKERQAELELAIRRIDETLCVIFKR